MISIIERALITISADKFANIARLYLSYRFSRVLSTGFALGKEKSKPGVPDNLIPLENGHYIFNEVTTINEVRLMTKLKKDIDHCFTQKIIPVERIFKIILICNKKISTAMYHELQEYQKEYSKKVPLKVIGVDELSNHIFCDYPGLCRELDIPFDSGQILNVEEFVNQNERSKFSTTLSNTFFSREDEINEALKCLNEGYNLLLSGKAGIGKTKLSLEISKQFLRGNQDYKVKYVKNNAGLSIWKDLKSILHKDTNYLVVIDDANKLKSNLDSICNFLNEDRSGTIRIILTVRDYIKTYIEKRFKGLYHIELEPLDKETVSQIINDFDLDISNYGKERMISISKGNPRLVAMAITSFKNKNYDKITDATSIHEEYFKAVNSDLDTLNNTELIKVGGVLALYENIDVNNQDHIKSIFSYFDIDRYQLIRGLKELYDYEIADQFNSIYKISDQILGEYLFYLVFIDKKYIPFKTLLNLFVSKRRHYLSRILYPIMDNYGTDNVREKTTSDVEAKWSKLKQSSEEDEIMSFLELFWHYIPTDTLMHVNQKVSSKPLILLTELKFEVYNLTSSERYDDDYIDILVNFSQFPSKLNFALEILFKYGLSSQLTFSKILKALRQSFSYGRYSLERKYEVQRIVLEYLYKKCETHPQFYSRIILFIADLYLIDSYDSKSGNDRSITIRQHLVQLIDVQKEFRTKLWRFIIDAYEDKALKNDVLNFFKTYRYGYINNPDIIQYDKKIILDFFIKSLPRTFEACLLVQDYLHRLDIHKIKYDECLKNEFQNKEYRIWHTLTLIAHDKENVFNEVVHTFEENDYLDLLEVIGVVKKNEVDSFPSVGYAPPHRSLNKILVYLSKVNFNMFIFLFREIGKYGLEEYLYPKPVIVQIDYKAVKSEIVKNVIYEMQNEQVKLSLLSYLPKEAIDRNDLDLVKELWKSNYINSYWNSLDFVINCIEIDICTSEAIGWLIDVLVCRSRKNSLTLPQDFFMRVQKEFDDVFKLKIDKLAQLYINIFKVDSSFDYRLDQLCLLLKFYPTMICDLIETLTKTKYSYRFDDISLDKIWTLDNAEKIIGLALNKLVQKPRYSFYTLHDANVLFKGDSQREKDFLMSRINDASSNREYVMLFNIVVTKYSENKFKYLKIILARNKDVHLFRELELYTRMHIHVRSRIPIFEYQVSLYQETISQLESMNSIELMPHIKLLEDRICYAQKNIIEEKAREFMTGE